MTDPRPNVPGHLEGHITKGETRFIHLVPKGECHSCGQNADCPCEPLPMVKFHGEHGGRLVLVVHRHDNWEIVHP